MTYHHRIAETTFKRYLKRFPIVGITGPRQSGKSTLVQHELPQYTYVTFDSVRHMDYFQEDPEGFMQMYNNKVIFDEVQYVPEIFRYIKLAVDKNRDKNGQFVLTGSAQFSFLKHAAESLAGRVGLLSVLPLQFSEIPKKYQAQSIYLGSLRYPLILNGSQNINQSFMLIH